MCTSWSLWPKISSSSTAVATAPIGPNASPAMASTLMGRQSVSTRHGTHTPQLTVSLPAPTVTAAQTFIP